MKEELWSDIAQVRAKSPLVHNITNYVVMNTTANALLAAGASPVMAHAQEEVADMVAIAGSLVINIGTLSPAWVAAMKIAMFNAARLGKPIVLDPVGAGATTYRSQVLAELMQTASPTVVRGNASEILALAGAASATKGVDSVHSSTSATSAAMQLAYATKGVVCISGATDVIVDAAGRKGLINNGHPLMTKVTGMGCTATALIGALCAVQPDGFRAAMAAMTLMGVAGELAHAHSKSPGSFQVAFFDSLYSLTESEFMAMAKIEVK